jgi:hypothetical protein
LWSTATGEGARGLKTQPDRKVTKEKFLGMLRMGDQEIIEKKKGGW